MLKALNLIGLYVKDIDASLSFYKTLGFELVSNDGSVAEVGLNGSRIQLVAQETARDQNESFQKDAFGEPKGTGVYLNVEVTAIDNYYKQLVEDGIKPSTEPKDWPWGQREFVVRDPDRYKLVFYEKRR
ncbi:MAG TPA: VOC family protein [Verrucomicrobiae bacterium]|nr:VOC family protein [Verrucomicrobiae bacterium]